MKITTLLYQPIKFKQLPKDLYHRSSLNFWNGLAWGERVRFRGLRSLVLQAAIQLADPASPEQKRAMLSGRVSPGVMLQTPVISDLFRRKHGGKSEPEGTRRSATHSEA